MSDIHVRRVDTPTTIDAQGKDGAGTAHTILSDADGVVIRQPKYKDYGLIIDAQNLPSGSTLYYGGSSTLAGASWFDNIGWATSGAFLFISSVGVAGSQNWITYIRRDSGGTTETAANNVPFTYATTSASTWFWSALSTLRAYSVTFAVTNKAASTANIQVRLQLFGT